MKLNLKKKSERYIDVTLPDETECRFVIKFATILESRANSKELDKLKGLHLSGDLDSFDYLSSTMRILISNWDKIKDRVFKSGLRSDHIPEIAEAIRDLQLKKEEPEKKSQSTKNMKK